MLERSMYNRVSMYQSDMIEIMKENPEMFGTLDMYLKTTMTEIQLLSDEGYPKGRIELFSKDGESLSRQTTRFVKSSLTDNGTWKVWKELKTAYPIKQLEVEIYLKMVDQELKWGQSLFNAQRSAEERLTGAGADWKSYIKIIQSFWRSITDWEDTAALESS